jgi:hypothetical protein
MDTHFIYVELAMSEETVEHVESSTPVPALERRSTTTRNRVQCKQDLVITWLQEFYSKPGNLEKLMPILKGESRMSLRLIDYFVTNYAKKMNTFYTFGARQFLVYFHYKRELSAYSKRLFDPFCRRERIQFEARDYEPFVTTVGQLNFFRWAIEKDILKYIEANCEAIEKDMNQTLRDHYSRSNTQKSSASATSSATSATSRESKQSLNSEALGATESQITSSASTSSSRKKRCELTQSAMKKVNFHSCNVVVSFN